MASDEQEQKQERNKGVLRFAQDDVSLLVLGRGRVRHWGAPGDEVDGAEEAGGDGADLVEVLHLKAVAVLLDEGL